MSDILSKVKCLVADSFEIPIERIGDDSSSQTIEQWDSVGHINLVMALEAEFGVSFAMEEIMRLHDVRAISKVLAEKTEK